MHALLWLFHSAVKKMDEGTTSALPSSVPSLEFDCGLPKEETRDRIGKNVGLSSYNFSH